MVVSGSIVVVKMFLFVSVLIKVGVEVCCFLIISGVVLVSFVVFVCFSCYCCYFEVD